MTLKFCHYLVLIETHRHKSLFYSELYVGVTRSKFLILLWLSAGIEHFCRQLYFSFHSHLVNALKEEIIFSVDFRKT